MEPSTPPPGAGDRRHLEQLLERHLPSLRAFVRLNVPPDVRAKESCSDLLQSACRQALADLSGFEFRGDSAFRAWLFRRALLTILDKARHYRAEKRDQRREQVMPEETALQLAQSYADLATPSRRAVMREEIERLELAFDELPDDYRRVITMAKIAQLPHAVIAVELGRTPKAVRNLLGRALARLSGILTPDEESDA